MPNRDEKSGEPLESSETFDDDDGLDSVEQELKHLLDAADLGAPDEPVQMLGETIADTYTLTERLGEGGMGTVFLAEHARTRGQVALKLIKANRLGDARAIRRFELEAKHTASLHHPNIVRVFDYGRDDDLVFLAMEYVPGTSVQKLLEDQGALDWPVAVSIGEQVLKALAAAHESEQQIIHRDIKPGNILVTDQDGDTHVKVLDFGIARALEGPSADTQGIIGSPQTMAPEQFDGGPLSPATDLYALGCTMYAMLCGHPPFEGSFSQLALKHCHEEPPPLDQQSGTEDVPRGLIAWVAELTRKEETERPTDAREAIASLAKLDPVSDVDTIPTPHQATAGDSRRPLRLRVLIVTTIVGLLVGAALFAARQSASSEQTATESETESRRDREERASPQQAPKRAYPEVGGQLALNVPDIEGPSGPDVALGPEGKRAAFLQEQMVEVVHLETGTASSILVPDGATPVDVSWFPDGEDLLTTMRNGRETSLWRVPLDGDPELLVPGGRHGVVSPDGKRVAFLRSSKKPGYAAVVVSNLDGSDAHTLAPAATKIAGWLSDNSAVAYLVVMDMAPVTLQLRVANEEINRTLLTDRRLNHSGVSSAATLPDRRVVFGLADIAPNGREGTNLWTLRVRDDFSPTEPTRLTETQGFAYNDISASLDGSALAYCRFSTQFDIETARLHADGSLGDIELLSGTSRQERPTDWSSDGERILFMSNRSGAWQAYAQAPDSAEAIQLSETDRWATWPRSVPGTNQVLFWDTSVEESIPGSRLMLVDDEGRHRQVLDELQGAAEPRRAGLPYPADVDVQCVGGESPTCIMHERAGLNRSFYEVDLEGHDLHRLFRLSVRDEITTANAHLWALREKQPQIAVAEGASIHLITLQTGEVVETIRIAGAVAQYLQWDPAGEGLFASVVSGESPRYRVIRISERRNQRDLVTSGEHWLSHVQTSPDGQRLAWARSNWKCAPWMLTLR